MRHLPPGYMAWAKTHRPARFELTCSGVPTVAPADLGLDRMEVKFQLGGAYGDSELIQAIADARGVPPTWVLPVPGTSTANFVALASVSEPGDTILVENPVYDPVVRAARLLGLGVEPFERRSCPGYPPNLESVQTGLDRGAVAVWVTNLHNPSGQLFPADDL